MHPLDDFKVNLPESRSGEWAIEKYTISEAEAALHNLKDRINSDSRRPVLAGSYTRLVKYDGLGEQGTFASRGLGENFLRPTVWMSDTPVEIMDHVELIARARGRVLIAGLGLGMCADAILRKPEVDQVIVVEPEFDVIKLVAPTLKQRWRNRFHTSICSIYDLEAGPGVEYDTIWFDIWPKIENSMYDDMKRLFASWRPALRPGGWMGAWCWRDIVALMHQDKVDARKIEYAMKLTGSLGTQVAQAQGEKGEGGK